MPEIFAFAGKGGVGKTTASGLLIRYLVETVKSGPVLAVDADPNANLNEVLGVEAYQTVGEARELMKTKVPAGMTKETWVELKVHESLVESKGYDLLVMGRPEGQGCYCAANTLVKKHIDLLKGNYAYVVVDNEAGMEHMSRLVTQDVDHLFVVSDATPRGLMTAGRILQLIGELNLNITKAHVLVNRVQPGREDELTGLARQKGLEADGVIHDDPFLSKADTEGSSVFSLDRRSTALLDAYRIFQRILERKE
ncbi:MAG: Septum site-determining protein MinD [Syntrophorhabdaceae bacterium PtaU1.Bin034]|jgi:CO dehydrogenase maturation factor|nr:MAG: Septum site-determining protein MinD [Syntrophorhabdaceae bacterium PtaU1.Bin034]